MLDESKLLMRDYPHLAAFERAIARREPPPRRGRPQYPGSKALRDIISEIVEDARAQGALPPGTDRVPRSRPSMR